MIVTPEYAARDAARVVSDVSVLCPRVVVQGGNGSARRFLLDSAARPAHWVARARGSGAAPTSTVQDRIVNRSSMPTLTHAVAALAAEAARHALYQLVDVARLRSIA